MNVMLTIVLAVQMLSALSMIGLILLQHGKGADMGAAFGSGSAGSLFGSAGAANFLSRTTAVLAALFFASSLALAYLATTKPREAGSVVDRAPAAQPKAEAPKPEPKNENEKPRGAEPGAPAEKSVPQ